MDWTKIYELEKQKTEQGTYLYEVVRVGGGRINYEESKNFNQREVPPLEYISTIEELGLEKQLTRLVEGK